MSNRDNPVRNNFVAKHMEEFNRPSTHVDRTKKTRPKYVRPVHEIDIHDQYLAEEEIWSDD